MFLSTVICAGAWGMIVAQTNPHTSGFAVIGLFYLTLLLALTGLFSLLGFWLRRRVFENALEFRQVEVAFHQGFILAALFVFLLFLSSQDRLNLYTALVPVGVAVWMEFKLRRARN